LVEEFRDSLLGNLVTLFARFGASQGICAYQRDSVRDCAVRIAIGIMESGKRSVLGVSRSLSESEVHYREFLQRLIARGLHGV
jgi:transposase-like protein